MRDLVLCNICDEKKAARDESTSAAAWTEATALHTDLSCENGHSKEMPTALRVAKNYVHEATRPKGLAPFGL